MDYKEIQGLMEAYSAVYDEEVREEYLKEDYSFIDGLNDEELTDVVEEVIYDLLDEGYEVEELEDLFEETFLTEAKVTMGRGDNPGSGRVTIGKGSLMAAKSRVAARKAARREERKEKIVSAAKGVLSNIKKGITRAAKKVGIGVEKAKRSMSGVDRGAERAQRRAKSKMTQTARAGIRKAITGKAEAPKAVEKTAKVTRKDVTGSTGAGAAGTIRSKSAAGSGDGPSSQGRALPPKGATSRTPAGNLRRGSQITYTLAKAQQAGKRRLALNNSFDLFDLVTDFLVSEGLAEDIREATWIMANELSEEHIDQIVDLYDLDEATAMKKRGYDETSIRNRIAKSTGGGEAADRATALADRPTFGNANKAKQRQNLARAQRGDFRNTTSSSPGLHGYAHQSNDPKVKAKQAARGAQRGVLTPKERGQLGR